MKLELSKRHIIIISAIALIITLCAIFIKPDGSIIIEEPGVPKGANTITARDAGLMPTDKEYASKNANSLIEALNQYSSIIIDDSYYIGTPSEPLTTRKVEIIGTGNAELIAKENACTILFDPAGLDSITIKNVKFTNNNTEKSFLIVYGKNPTGSKVDYVDIAGCTFTGSISLYRQYGDQSLDPDIVDFGIGKFLFTNNKVMNTELSFLVLKDIPVGYFEISDNTVNNFMYTFMSLAISNETPFENELYDYIKYLKVENNSVFCEDNWWGNTSSGLYYSFIVFEGTEVLYNKNHVEGIKALSNIAVYDAYLSANTVNYTNNTWKNNICFAADKTNNTLLKSKGGGSDSLVRTYSNNTFIVDEDFAARVGQPKDNLFVSFISLTRHADSYTIAGNIFDIYDLRFPVSSSQISNFYLTDNKIKAKKASGCLGIVRLNDNFPTDAVEVKNNTIEIDASSIKPFNLVKVVDARNTGADIAGKIEVSGNRITAPVGYLFYDVKADKLIFTDNQITDRGNKYVDFAYKGQFSDMEVSGNSIETAKSISLYNGTQIFAVKTDKKQ